MGFYGSNDPTNSVKALKEECRNNLNSGWNIVYTAVFGFKTWESVKEIQMLSSHFCFVYVFVFMYVVLLLT